MIQPLLEARAEMKNIFVGFLAQMKSLEFAFESNWPLGKKEIKFIKLDFSNWIFQKPSSDK